MTQGLDTEEKNEIFEKEYRKAIGVHHRLQLMTKALSGCGTVSPNSCNKKKVCAF